MDPNIGWHLRTRHSNQEEVKKIMMHDAKPEDSDDVKKAKAKLRKEMFHALRKKGNFLHNKSAG